MLNLNRLKKSEILWLWRHRCRHNHRYLEHLNCFIEEKPEISPLAEHVGYLDIETTGLNANWDYIISYAIIDENDKVYGRTAKRNEVLSPDILDKKLMSEFVKDINKFDRVVVYWGKDRRHDLPFLRTRCLKWHLDFPMYRDIYVTDVYDIVKAKLRLHRNRMENACEFLGIPAKEHRLDAEMWQKAKLGVKEALDYVWKHNYEDVVSLKKLHETLERFSASRKISI